MENVIHTAPQTVIPALYKAAAVSVIALSVAGIGAMTGYLPLNKANAPLNNATATAPALPAQTLPAAMTAPIAQPTPAAIQAPVTERITKPRVIRTTSRPTDEPTGRVSPVSNHPVAVSASGSDGAPYPQKNAQNYPQPTYPQGQSYPQGDAYPQARTYPQPASQPNASSYPSNNPQVAQGNMPVRATCNACGTIESVRTVEKPGEASGVGIAGGALGGGMLGRQFGNGRGRDVLTVLGAIGGGIAGNQIEKSVRTTKAYEVTIRMEDGSVRTVPSASQPNWRTGERVRVDGSNISIDYS